MLDKPVVVDSTGTFVTSQGQTIHPLTAEAVNALWCADPDGVAVFAREAPEFAPEKDKAEDTVIVVLRGEAARRGRKALCEVADLVR